MNTITNLHTSLFILNECHDTIEYLYFLFKKADQRDIPYYKNFSQHEINRYIILNVASFLDEYQIHFVQKKQSNPRPKPIEAEYTERIKHLDGVITPILNTINRWKDIGEYRDHFVAHANRSRWSRELKISSQEPYDAPRQLWEFQLLHDLINIMFGLIAQEFKTEVNEAWFFAKTLKAVINPNKNNTYIKEELESMVEKFQTICQKQGKSYSLNIREIIYEPLRKLVESYPPFSHPLPFINYRARTGQF
jgi:hypothetical protein